MIKLGFPRFAKRDRPGCLVDARTGGRLVWPLHRVADLQFNRRFFVPDENEIILLQVLVIRIGGVLHQPQRVLAAQAQYDWLGTVLVGQEDVGVFHT